MRRRLAVDDMGSRALVDHLPAFLDELIERVDTLAEGRQAPQARQASRAHGVHRAVQGFRLADIVLEHAVLREILHRRQIAPDERVRRWIDLAIDHAVAVAAEEFTHEREREGRALERITAALREARAPELLVELLTILVEETHSVSAGALYLREEGGLCERAVVGRVQDAEAMRALAEEVASRRAEHSAEGGGKVRYGVPLLAGGELFGAVCVSADLRLQEAHRRMLHLLAEQAAGAIAQQVLREEAEARADAVQVAYEALEHGDAAYVLDPEGRFVFVNRAAERLLDTPREHLLGRVVWELKALVGQGGSSLGKALRQAVQDGRPTSFEARQADGVWVDVSAYPRQEGGLAVFLRDVTERRAVQARVQIFQRFLDVHPDLFHVLDREGRIVWVSPSVLEAWGRGQDEMLGRTFEELGLPAAIARTLEDGLRQALAGETVRDLASVEGSPGHPRVYEYVFAPLPAEGEGPVELVAAVARDVTEQHAHAEWDRLVARVTRLTEAPDVEHALEEVPRLVVPALGEVCNIILVEEGRVVRRAAYADDPGKLERLARIIRDFPEDLSVPGGLADVARGSGALLVPFVNHDALAEAPVLLREYAEALDVESYMALPLQARDRVLGAISFTSSQPGFFNEERLKLAREVARKAAVVLDNARLLRDLERAVRSRDDVLAVVSHDLRNPLSAVRLSTQLLSRTPQPPEALLQRTIETIDRSSAQMNRLISDLVDVASLQKGKLRMEPVEQELEPVLREAVESHGEAARAKGVHLEERLSVEGVRLWFDRDRLLQVLGNLIGNALRACGPGDSVVVRAWVDEDRAFVAVEDTGPGVPEEIRDQLFEPYGVMRKRREGGTGLGLFISRGIVQAHGGTLEVDSTPGQGARFTMAFPRPR